MTKTQTKFLQDALTKQMGAKIVQVRIPSKGVYEVPLNAKSVEKIKDETFLIEKSDKIIENSVRRVVRSYKVNPDLKVGQDAAKVREWAKANGYKVGTRGRFPKDVIDAYKAAHA